MRRFHVQREARDRYGVDGTLLGVRGDLLVDGPGRRSAGWRTG